MIQKSAVITCVFFLFLIMGANAFASDFKGFYIGGNAGSANGNSDVSMSTVFSLSGYFGAQHVQQINSVGGQNLTPSGFTGGGQAGYNFQHGPVVFGLETDFGTMGLNHTRSVSTPYICCVFPNGTSFTITQSVTTDWLFTVRPRLGFAVRRLLIYGTGGMAMTNANYQGLFTDNFENAHENAGQEETLTGWTAGGGVEFQIKRRWSVKGEYLHADFGKMTTLTSNNLTAFPPRIGFPSNPFTHTASLQAEIYRFGVNFHF